VAIETVLFRESVAADKAKTSPSLATGSLWGALKRLYKAVLS